MDIKNVTRSSFRASVATRNPQDVSIDLSYRRDDDLSVALIGMRGKIRCNNCGTTIFCVDIKNVKQPILIE